MTRISIAKSRAAGAALALSLATTQAVAADRYVGGGTVSGFTQECSPSNSSITERVTSPRVFYTPGETNNGVSYLTLNDTGGQIAFTMFNPTSPSRTYFRTPGGEDTVWGRVAYPRNTRPNIRTFARVVTSPPGAEITQADEIFLRMTIRTYWGRPGCTVRLAATLVNIDTINYAVGGTQDGMTATGAEPGAGATPPEGSH